MSGDAIALVRPTSLAGVLAALERANAPQIPLVRAVADGSIALVHLSHADAAWPRHDIERIQRPTLILVGDDPPSGSTVGPNAWRCVNPIRRFARAAVVHGAHGLPAHYQNAVAMTMQFGRVVFVETSARFIRAWIDVFRHVPCHAIIPDDAHPMAAPESRH